MRIGRPKLRLCVNKIPSPMYIIISWELTYSKLLITLLMKNQEFSEKHTEKFAHQQEPSQDLAYTNKNLEKEGKFSKQIWKPKWVLNSYHEARTLKIENIRRHPIYHVGVNLKVKDMIIQEIEFYSIEEIISTKYPSSHKRNPLATRKKKCPHKKPIGFNWLATHLLVPTMANSTPQFSWQYPSHSIPEEVRELL